MNQCLDYNANVFTVLYRKVGKIDIKATDTEIKTDLKVRFALFIV